MDLQDKSRLCSLPDEILIHVLRLAHPVSLVACQAVCKLLLKIIERTMFLQYQIELYSGGMIDGEHCPLAVAERLSLLRSRRQAWKELKWSRQVTPLIPGSWSAYELVDGVFSKTLHSARGILFATLPSPDAPGSLTAVDDVGIPFRDFAMDPTQDLIVYMQCNPVPARPGVMYTQVLLIFRTMSDNKMHPLALRPSVDILLPSEVRGAVIQTVNEIVGFMSWDDTRARLFIHDWRRCIPLVAINDLARLDDFAFISDQAYVLTSPGPDAYFRVFTFDANPSQHHIPDPPKLRATLRLPPMQEGASTALLGIHTGPFTTTSQQPRGRSRPFMRAPQCRIHVVNIELSSNDAAEPIVSCLMVIHNRTFLSFVSQEEPVDISWEDWGLDNTRWLTGGTGSSWLRYVHGERLVRLHATVESGPPNLEVYDFGAPYAPRSWLSREEDAAIRQTHNLVIDSVFIEPVVSRLPCRVVIKEGFFPYSGFMIDEERLIGLKHHWANDVESVDVFTF